MMKTMTTKQRKTAYLIGIVVLLAPILILGMPAGGRLGGEASEGGLASRGGVLAQMKSAHDLGETNLGDVDPTSSTMNLVLLGMRGVAANLLWMDAIRHQETKNWAQLRANVESIIKLQPHFIQVWRFQGWNLAWNVSAEWDAVADRYYWVKEGAKFTIRGTRRNERVPDLYWEVGRVLGNKIGLSDEWEYFRRYFNPRAYPHLDDDEKGDPDPKYKRSDGSPGPDTDLNPEEKDNYLVAKEWRRMANEREGTPEGEIRYRQHIQDRALFRSQRAREQFNYAQALHREGRFEEESRIAWLQAYQDWTTRFEDGTPGLGRELYKFGEAGLIRLDLDSDYQFRTLVRELADVEGEFTGAEFEQRVEAKKFATDRYRKILNYTYWRRLARVEQTEEMLLAHREVYEGKEHLKLAEFRRAKDSLLSGLQKFERVFLRNPELRIDDELVEQILLAQMCWKYLHEERGVPVPPPPLQSLQQEHNARLPDIDREFRREFRTTP